MSIKKKRLGKNQKEWWKATGKQPEMDGYPMDFERRIPLGWFSAELDTSAEEDMAIPLLVRRTILFRPQSGDDCWKSCSYLPLRGVGLACYSNISLIKLTTTTTSYSIGCYPRESRSFSFHAVTVASHLHRHLNDSISNQSVSFKLCQSFAWFQNLNGIIWFIQVQSIHIQHSSESKWTWWKTIPKT